MSSSPSSRHAPTGSLSYAAVAGSKSPPFGKHHDDSQTRTGDGNLKKSPGHVFSVKSKPNAGAATMSTSPKNGESMPKGLALGDTAQHHDEKGSVHQKNQSLLSGSSFPDPSIIKNDAKELPAVVPAQKMAHEESMAASNPNNMTKVTQQLKPDRTSTQVDVPETDPIQTRIDTPKTSVSGCENKTRPDGECNQSNLPPVVPASSVSGDHQPGIDKPTVTGNAEEHSSGPAKVPTRPGIAWDDYPWGDGDDYRSRPVKPNTVKRLNEQIAALDKDVDEYTWYLGRVADDMCEKDVENRNLKEELTQKSKDLIEARLEALKAVQLEGQLRELRAKYENLDSKRRWYDRTFDAYKSANKAKDAELEQLVAENEKLRKIIVTGVVSITDLFGHHGHASFARNARMQMGAPLVGGKQQPPLPEDQPMAPAGARRPQMPCSNKSPTASTAVLASQDTGCSSLQNSQQASKQVPEPQRAPEDPFVQDSRDTSTANIVTASSSELVGTSRAPVDHDVSVKVDSKAQSKSNSQPQSQPQPQGSKSWAEQVEEEDEGQQEKPKTRKDVTSAVEAPRDAPEARENKHGKAAQTPEEPSKVQKPAPLEPSKPQDDAKPASALRPMPSPPRARGSALPPTIGENEAKPAAAGEEVAAGGKAPSSSHAPADNTARGAQTKKLTDIHMNRKQRRAKQQQQQQQHYQQQSAATKASNDETAARIGSARRGEAVIEDKDKKKDGKYGGKGNDKGKGKAAEEDSGWTSVKGKARPGWQPKPRAQDHAAPGNPRPLGPRHDDLFGPGTAFFPSRNPNAK